MIDLLVNKQLALCLSIVDLIEMLLEMSFIFGSKKAFTPL